MSELIISVSGLRGIVGESLTPEVAVRYARAFSATLPSGPVVLTRDGRQSGGMLGAAIADGLQTCGRAVIDAGIAATPTTGVLVRQMSAAGGIQISASHNPAPYNGMKLFSRAGRVIPQVEGLQVLEWYRKDPPLAAPALHLPAILTCEDTLSEHLRLVLATVHVERIQRRKFQVLLDSNRGAGSLLGRPLLKALGCQVTLLGGVPDGQFEHVPEPTAENLAGVLQSVTDHGCDIGFCQDPDADRLAVVDAAGRYIGEEYTLALCVQHVLAQTPGAVVTNCSTSRMTEDLAKQFGVPLVRTAVGEANVVDAMLASGAVLGGEGNGGVIDPRVGLVRDSFVGMALLLDLMAERGDSIGALADALPRYEIVKTKFTLPADKTAAALAAIERQFPQAQSNRQDGLRLDWPHKWLLVRASNTEPIVRAVAEAPTLAEAEELCGQAQKAISLI